MQRALDLASKAAGYTAPNPLVGAVLVHNEKIIGEGYHELYGQAHAEVNCIRSVPEDKKHLISQSTMYVTLEPCAHFGKTPPCADLIIQSKIPEVIIGTRDPFAQVDGKGIDKLLAAGINVQTGILEQQCKELNKRFFTYHIHKRPYVILKWAQTVNAKVGSEESRLIITHPVTNRLVHKWRSEEMSIMVGTNTAIQDDPLLTNRYYGHLQPTRIVLDKHLKLPTTLKLFDQSVKTLVLNMVKTEVKNLVTYQKIEDAQMDIASILDTLYQLNIQSVFVEGGPKLLQSFIHSGLWDEARVITNEKLFLDQGIDAPQLKYAQLQKQELISNDHIYYYQRQVI